MQHAGRGPADTFAEVRERELAQQAATWDTAAPVPADPDDLPRLDVAELFATGDPDELERLATELRWVGENVGFHLLTGHGIPMEQFEAVFAAAADFLSLPDDVKAEITIDDTDAVVPGVGWLPVGERRLPRRAKGNLNEAILFKQDREIRIRDNPWPSSALLPTFRETVERYAARIEQVALALLPVYARALELPADWFGPAFESPFYRLRMTRYQPVTGIVADEFGIAPHVDTTFFTLLAQSGPGLVIYGEQRGRWLEVPFVPGALVVNTGELLRQWSNDRFLSVKHFVPPNQGVRDRYSVPFFFNATADHRMVCLPSCHGPENPPRYPPVSYLESQAAAQRE